MNVTYKPRVFENYLPVWKAVRDCVLGQKQIKSKGEVYLPGFSDNDPDRYAAYLQRAVFLNVTQRTLASLVGAAMRKPPEVVVPANMDYITEDADNSGNSLVQLIKSNIDSVMSVGRHGLLVDYPSAEGEMTVDDVRRLGLRPAIKEYRAETIINWKEEAGKLILVVLLEYEQVETDVFSVTEEETYRVLRMVDGFYIQEIYDKGGNLVTSAEPKKADGSRWEEIPFLFPGSMNNSPDIDIAPMYDIAVVNIGHYINSADYEEGLHLASQPMLHIDIGNMNTSEWVKLNPNGIEVGSRRGIVTQGGGSATLLQTQANSAAEKALEHKEAQMVKLGARLVESGGANQTAEAVKTDRAAEHSVLTSVVSNVGEAIEKCLKWACLFDGSNPEEVEVNMNLEFFDGMPDAQMIAAMMGLEDRGHMAQSDIRDYLRKTGILDSERTDEDIDGDTNMDDNLGGDDLTDDLEDE